MTRPHFNRILLKLSGEALMGQGQFGIDPAAVDGLASEIAAAKAQGHELCLVVGGGNIFRGMAAAAKGFDRATADYMGMLATVMRMPSPFRNPAAEAAAEAGATGHLMGQRFGALHSQASPSAPGEGPHRALRRGHRPPFFTTDTGAALRAAEWVATRSSRARVWMVIYTADPKKVADATRYETVTFDSSGATI